MELSVGNALQFPQGFQFAFETCQASSKDLEDVSSLKYKLKRLWFFEDSG